MKIKVSQLLLIAGVTLLFLPAFFSCKKDTPTKAVITVLDTNDVPVAGATVSVFQDSVINQITGVRANIRDTKVSDASGKTEHEFKWEAFLNIEAIRADSSDTARGYIRLEYQKTMEATVQFH
jgi:hypothetical protein